MNRAGRWENMRKVCKPQDRTSRFTNFLSLFQVVFSHENKIFSKDLKDIRLNCHYNFVEARTCQLFPSRRAVWGIIFENF